MSGFAAVFTKRSASREVADQEFGVSHNFWWPLRIKGKYMEDLMYCALHWRLLELYKFNHPCADLILQLRRCWRWAQRLARCAPAGRPEFNKATSGQNVLLEWIQVSWRHAWAVEGSGSENEVMVVGLLHPPSHLCAVEPRGRQLLPLIITPNGWIHFLLTSSSWHNIIPTVHHPNTPSSRQRPSRIPDPTWPDGQQSGKDLRV